MEVPKTSVLETKTSLIVKLPVNYKGLLEVVITDVDESSVCEENFFKH